jgi:hypothetical protein
MIKINVELAEKLLRECNEDIAILEKYYRERDLIKNGVIAGYSEDWGSQLHMNNPPIKTPVHCLEKAGDI